MYKLEEEGLSASVLTPDINLQMAMLTHDRNTFSSQLPDAVSFARALPLRSLQQENPLAQSSQSGPAPLVPGITPFTDRLSSYFTIYYAEEG